MEDRELVDSKDDILTTKLDPFDFKNPVENPCENYRIRRCNIYYYLSDNTVHINEPKTRRDLILSWIKDQKLSPILSEYLNLSVMNDLN